MPPKRPAPKRKRNTHKNNPDNQLNDLEILTSTNIPIFFKNDDLFDFFDKYEHLKIYKNQFTEIVNIQKHSYVLQNYFEKKTNTTDTIINNKEAIKEAIEKQSAFSLDNYGLIELLIVLHTRQTTNGASIRNKKYVTPHTILDYPLIDTLIKDSNNQTQNNNRFIIPAKMIKVSNTSIENFLLQEKQHEENPQVNWSDKANIFRSNAFMEKYIKFMIKNDNRLSVFNKENTNSNIKSVLRRVVWETIANKIINEPGYISTHIGIHMFFKDYFTYWKYLVFAYQDGDDIIDYDTDITNVTEFEYRRIKERMEKRIANLMKLGTSLPIYKLNNASNLKSDTTKDLEYLKENAPFLGNMYHTFMMRWYKDKNDNHSIIHDNFESFAFLDACKSSFTNFKDIFEKIIETIGNEAMRKDTRDNFIENYISKMEYNFIDTDRKPGQTNVACELYEPTYKINIISSSNYHSFQCNHDSCTKFATHDYFKTMYFCSDHNGAESCNSAFEYKCSHQDNPDDHTSYCDTTATYFDDKNGIWYCDTHGANQNLKKISCSQENCANAVEYMTNSPCNGKYCKDHIPENEDMQDISIFNDLRQLLDVRSIEEEDWNKKWDYWEDYQGFYYKAFTNIHDNEYLRELVKDLFMIYDYEEVQTQTQTTETSTEPTKQYKIKKSMDYIFFECFYNIIMGMGKDKQYQEIYYNYKSKILSKFFNYYRNNIIKEIEFVEEKKTKELQKNNNKTINETTNQKIIEYDQIISYLNRQIENKISLSFEPFSKKDGGSEYLPLYLYTNMFSSISIMIDTNILHDNLQSRDYLNRTEEKNINRVYDNIKILVPKIEKDEGTPTASKTNVKPIGRYFTKRGIVHYISTHSINRYFSYDSLVGSIEYDRIYTNIELCEKNNSIKLMTDLFQDNLIYLIRLLLHNNVIYVQNKPIKVNISDPKKQIFINSATLPRKLPYTIEGKRIDIGFCVPLPTVSPEKNIDSVMHTVQSAMPLQDIGDQLSKSCTYNAKKIEENKNKIGNTVVEWIRKLNDDWKQTKAQLTETFMQMDEKDRMKQESEMDKFDENTKNNQVVQDFIKESQNTMQNMQNQQTGGFQLKHLPITRKRRDRKKSRTYTLKNNQ